MADPTSSSRASSPRVDEPTEASLERVGNIIKGNIKFLMNYAKELSEKHGNTKMSKEVPNLQKYLTTLDTNYCKLQNHMRNATTIIAGNEAEIKNLKQELNKIKAMKFDELTKNRPVQTEVRNQKAGMSTTRSYAQATANVNASVSPTVNKTSHVVIIEPKNENDMSNSANTLKLFKYGLDYKVLRDKKISIKSQKLTTNCRVVVSCDSERECKAIYDEMTNNEHLRATIPRKKCPQVIILGVDGSIPKEEVFGLIIAQNRGLESFSSCRFEANYEKTDRFGTKFVVAEVEPRLYTKLIETEKICLGFSLCPVKSRIPVIRCYKCSRYGHKHAECRNELSCASCAGQHETKNCTSPDLKCSNCNYVNGNNTKRNRPQIDTKHRADDHCCPQYQHVLNIVRKQYNFG